MDCTRFVWNCQWTFVCICTCIGILNGSAMAAFNHNPFLSYRQTGMLIQQITYIIKMSVILLFSIQYFRFHTVSFAEKSILNGKCDYQ